MILVGLVLGGVVWCPTLAQQTPKPKQEQADSTTEKKTTKSGYTREQDLGGPTSVGAQLEEEDRLKHTVLQIPVMENVLERYFNWKEGLNQKGFRFGVDYNATVQKANAGRDKEDFAATGIFRTFGKWTLVGRESGNRGSLVFGYENRTKLGTAIPPGDLGFAVGYRGITGTLFSDVGWILNSFYWDQAFGGGRGGLIIGRFDPNDFMDVSGYANPWTTFQNLSMLLNTSIALPDVGFGASGGTFITEHWYVLGAFNDANGVITDIDFYQDGPEFFKQLEIGWTPSRDQRFFQNAHVTFWHVDKRENKDVPESWGATFATNWLFEDRWMPFFRAGWSDGQAPLMNRAVTGGIGRLIAESSHVVGLAAGWGDPSDSSLRHQYTSELFLRLQLSQNFVLTPNLQLLIHPAHDPDRDLITVLGLRLRLTL